MSTTPGMDHRHAVFACSPTNGVVFTTNYCVLSSKLYIDAYKIQISLDIALKRVKIFQLWTVLPVLELSTGLPSEPRISLDVRVISRS